MASMLPGRGFTDGSVTLVEYALGVGGHHVS